MPIPQYPPDSGPHAHLSAEARGVLPWFYWGASSYMLHRPAELTGTIAASLADPDAEMWWTLGEKEITQGTGRPEKADMTISGESGTFVLVLAGRITPEDALRTTSLSALGDEKTAKSFLSSWKITCSARQGGACDGASTLMPGRNRPKPAEIHASGRSRGRTRRREGPAGGLPL